MIITDHYRPGGCPTAFTAFAAPVGSRADVVLVYTKNGVAHFHRLDDGRRPQAVGAGGLSSGWTADKIIDHLGERTTLPPDAMPLPQLVPFRSNAPILVAHLAPDMYRGATIDKLHAPRPGAIRRQSPAMIVSSDFETDGGTRRVSSFSLAGVLPPDRSQVVRVLASGPDGRLACGHALRHLRYDQTAYVDLCMYRGWYGTADMSPALPVTREALIGDSGHGIWAYRNGVLLFVPNGEGPKPKEYRDLFDPPEPARVETRTLYDLDDRRPFRYLTQTPPPPVELLAVSPRHAVRIQFGTDLNGGIEMVFDRRRLDPYSDSFERVEGWTVPIDLSQASTQQPGVCAFISPGEEALLVYIPVYQGKMSVGGRSKQLLVRTLCMDLE